MEYSKEFLKEFKVDTGQTYIVVPVDGKLHEVPLSRKNTNKKYFASYSFYFDQNHNKI